MARSRSPATYCTATEAGGTGEEEGIPEGSVAALDERRSGRRSYEVNDVCPGNTADASTRMPGRKDRGVWVTNSVTEYSEFLRKCA